MAEKHELGKWGEQLAVNYLLDKNYEIQKTNWRYSRAEVDIIAKDGEVLVFVEVKSRSYDFFGQPEDFVDAKKRMLLSEAAAAYMEEVDHEWEIRFDIISILMEKSGRYTLKHFEDAFFPGLELY